MSSLKSYAPRSPSGPALWKTDQTSAQAPRLGIYKHYCSRHAEALELIHEAERNTSDWAQYEDTCSDMIRWQSEAAYKSAAVAEKHRAQSQHQAAQSLGGEEPTMGSTQSSPMPPLAGRTESDSSLPTAPSAATAFRPDIDSASKQKEDLRPASPVVSPATSSGPSTVASSTVASAVNSLAPNSGITTQQSSAATGLSASGTAVAANNTRRGPLLRFHDFFVKPVQRIMLYRLMLTTVQKQVGGLPESALQEDMLAAVDDALQSVSRAAEQVDEAGKERERELLSEMVALRTLPHPVLTLNLLRRLGPVVLAGPLRVFYHHTHYAPAEVPIRFKYLSLILFHDMLVMAKVRKNGAYEVRHYGCLARASVTTWPYMNDPLLLSRSSAYFRLTFAGEHHIELAALNERERDLWLATLEHQINQANNPDVPSPARLRRGEPFPSSFPAPLPVRSDKGSLDVNVPSSPLLTPLDGAGRPDRPVSRAPSPAPKVSAITSHTAMLKPDPLLAAFSSALNRASTPQPPGVTNDPEDTAPPSVDGLIKTPSWTQCASADKHMMMSATCVAVHQTMTASGGTGTGSGASSGSRVHWGVSSPAQLLLRASAPSAGEKELESGGTDSRRARVRLSSTPLLPGPLMGGATSGSGSAVVAAARMQRRKSIGEYTLLAQANPTKKIRVLDIASTSADALPSPGEVPSPGERRRGSQEHAPAPTLPLPSRASGLVLPPPNVPTIASLGVEPSAAPGNSGAGGGTGSTSLTLDSWRMPFRRKHPSLAWGAGGPSPPASQPTASGITFPSSDDDGTGATQINHLPPSCPSGSSAAALLFKHKRKTTSSLTALSSLAHHGRTSGGKDEHRQDRPHLPRGGRNTPPPPPPPPPEKSTATAVRRAQRLFTPFHHRDRVAPGSERSVSPTPPPPTGSEGSGFVRSRGYKVTPALANRLVNQHPSVDLPRR